MTALRYVAKFNPFLSLDCVGLVGKKVWGCYLATLDVLCVCPTKESEARKSAERGEGLAARLAEREAQIGRLEAAAEAAGKEAEGLRSKLGRCTIQRSGIVGKKSLI